MCEGKLDLMLESSKWIFNIDFSKIIIKNIVIRERLMDPNADLTDSEIRLGKGEQVKVSQLLFFLLLSFHPFVFLLQCFDCLWNLFN